MLDKGFTLIELMIVLAIIMILVAIAIPAYKDYNKRNYYEDGSRRINPLTQKQLQSIKDKGSTGTVVDQLPLEYIKNNQRVTSEKMILKKHTDGKMYSCSTTTGKCYPTMID